MKDGSLTLDVLDWDFACYRKIGSVQVRNNYVLQKTETKDKVITNVLDWDFACYRKIGSVQVRNNHVLQKTETKTKTKT